MLSGIYKKAIFIAFLLILAGGGLLTAQSDIIIDTETEERLDDAPGKTEIEPLPGGYGDIQLGMDLETVKELLSADPNFNYRGEPDVTMLPQGEQELIDCDGTLYVDRAFFQFEDGRLFLIIMVFDPEFIDHYSIYTAFIKKYGESSSLNPSKAVWENESVIISLERPLSLKYMDKEVFDALQSESEASKAFEAEHRQSFIDSF